LADPYLIPGTDVLRNKLGIMDPDHLDRQIDDFAIVEASYLFNEGPPVRPSLAGWQAVHKAMFGEVFDWAGDFRTIHIRKLDENSDPSGYFTAPERIEPDGRKGARNKDSIDDSVGLSNCGPVVYISKQALGHAAPWELLGNVCRCLIAVASDRGLDAHGDEGARAFRAGRPPVLRR
jgi:hypothetical protein